MLRHLVFLAFVSACATSRTEYGKFSKKKAGGYQEKTLDDGLRAVTFRANAATKADLAQKFATFRAIELCQKENRKLTHVLDVFDKSQSKTVTRTTGSGYPSYYYGMSPYYGRYSGFGLGVGTMSSSSYSETLKYPEIEVVYECASEVFEPGVKFREVPADEMKLLVKDLRGGLQVERISPEAQGSPLRNGDIVLSGNGERIQQTYQLLNLFHKSPDHAIQVQILRDGVLKQGLKLTGIDASEKILAAQSGVLRSVCKKKELAENPLCRK